MFVSSLLASRSLLRVWVTARDQVCLWQIPPPGVASPSPSERRSLRFPWSLARRGYLRGHSCVVSREASPYAILSTTKISCKTEMKTRRGIARRAPQGALLRCPLGADSFALCIPACDSLGINFWGRGKACVEARCLARGCPFAPSGEETGSQRPLLLRHRPAASTHGLSLLPLVWGPFFASASPDARCGFPVGLEAGKRGPPALCVSGSVLAVLRLLLLHVNFRRSKQVPIRWRPGVLIQAALSLRSMWGELTPRRCSVSPPHGAFLLPGLVCILLGLYLN